jgi:hypothetical protein
MHASPPHASRIYAVVYGIKLKQAKNDEERKAIEEIMLGDAKLRAIHDALYKTSTASQRNIDRERNLIQEARNLRAGGADRGDVAAIGDRTTEPFWNKRPKAVVDLEALSFEAEGHFMSNKDCKLPKKSEIINKKVCIYLVIYIFSNEFCLCS